MNKTWLRIAAIALAVGTVNPVCGADPGGGGETAAEGAAHDAGSMGMPEVVALIKQQQAQLAAQQKQLAEQRELLEKQSRQIGVLSQELDALRTAPVQAAAREQIAAAPPAAPSTAPQAVAQGAGPKAAAGLESPEQKQVAKEALAEQTDEMVASAQQDDPAAQKMADFQGAWRLPGTRAALAIGGYVRTSVVYNWDPLEIPDRFIVGSIPVDSPSNEVAQSSLTANQSRLNFDLREPTPVGIMRAFIEGDFADSDDYFRLRHAFGQWKRLLAGKTWSAFVDTQATPEEVDFEGLNARINVRQAQLRFSPRLGESFQFQFSMENPNPQVQNGQGVTRLPDLVMSARFQPNDRLHTKVALLGRQIRAQIDQDLVPGKSGVEKKYAWGMTVSGSYSTPRFDTRDSILYQFNIGNGIGRYVNDLESVGQYDGIINPENGDLALFDVFAGYVSAQHWWGATTRSNMTLGYVKLDNPGFVAGDAYKDTIRYSVNYFWTPIPRINMGIEYLWGQRQDQNGDNGSASQMQMMLRYNFR